MRALLLRVPRRSGPRCILPAALLLAGLALLCPHEVRAQVEPTLNELARWYQAASEAYQAQLTGREAQYRSLQRALAEADSARVSGDEERENEAFAAVMRESAEMDRLDREVEEAAEALQDTREPYLAALSERLDELVAELRANQDPQEQTDLRAILRATNDRYEVLLQESFEEPELELQVASEWTIRTTDTPNDIRTKARALDRRADQFELQRALTEERLQRLVEDQRRSRTIADFLADFQRFDDTRTPVVRPGARNTDPSNPDQALPPGADTLGLEERPLTLDEQIASLQALRDRLADYIQRYRDRAELFRRRAGGGGEWA